MVYRTTGAGNTKPRPEFYSKQTAVQSFLASVQLVPDLHDIVFIVDGPMDDEELQPLRRVGEVLMLDGVGNSASYRRALALLDERAHWHDDDVVYFAEDDYLYQREAFQRLVGAARALEQASFFTLYDAPDYHHHAAHLRFARLHRREQWPVDNIVWRSVRSTTMTFGARVAAMRRVSYLHVLGTRGTYPRDFDIWSASQTYLPRYLWVRSFLSSAAAAPVPSMRTTARAVFGALIGEPPRNLLVAPPRADGHAHGGRRARSGRGLGSGGSLDRAGSPRTGRSLTRNSYNPTEPQIGRSPCNRHETLVIQERNGEPIGLLFTEVVT